MKECQSDSLWEVFSCKSDDRDAFFVTLLAFSAQVTLSVGIDE